MASLQMLTACLFLFQSCASLNLDSSPSDKNLEESGITCNNMKMPSDQTRSLALCGALVSHEKKLRAVMDRLLDYMPTKVNVMDAGAWMGDTTISLAQHGNVAQVFAVDPSEKNCDFMAQTAELNALRNIKILNMALGSSKGKYTADLPPRARAVAGNSAWSLMESRAEGSAGVAAGSSLDSLYEEGTFTNLALIHMDVKGMELPVIEGAVHLLNSRRPVVVTQVTLPEGAAEYKQMEKLMQNQKYVAYSVEESCLGPRSVISKVTRKCRNIIHIPREHAILRKAVMNTNDAHVTELRPLVDGASQVIDLGP